MTNTARTLVFATANRNKLVEAAEVLGDSFTICLPADLGYTNDVPETHFTIRENAIEKAQFIWDMFGKDCFADDTGLEVDTLDGAPGVFSARYAGEPKNPVMNVRKLLHEMEGVPYAERTARFRCVIALIEGGPDCAGGGVAGGADAAGSFVAGGKLTVFEGICEGHISLEPHGELGFGYDPVFIPDGMEKTMAMLTLEEKNATSHRGRALEQLVRYLKEGAASGGSADLPQE